MNLSIVNTLTERMDVEDLFLTSLIMIEDTGVLRRICVNGILRQLPDAVLKLSTEG